VGEIFVRVYNEVPTFQLEVSSLLLILSDAFSNLLLKAAGLFKFCIVNTIILLCQTLEMNLGKYMMGRPLTA
jgi:hypothetical protein